MVVKGGGLLDGCLLLFSSVFCFALFSCRVVLAGARYPRTFVRRDTQTGLTGCASFELEGGNTFFAVVSRVGIGGVSRYTVTFVNVISSIEVHEGMM